MSRYAGPGSHRYPLVFSGDSVISWASLDFQPYFTSTASNIGYTWWSHNIGGHMQGYKDAELSLRWLQFGVFSPINRLHSSKSEFTSKEPWHFDAVIEQSMIDFFQLRHQLIPYLYSANLITASEGRALVEPLYYEYPMEEEAYQHRNQYLLGEQLMVAPITEKMNSLLQMGSVEVWFPEGTWYDFFSGQPYDGKVSLKVYREITEMPVFAKAGAIIPLDKNSLKKEEIPSEIIWKIFPGADGEYLLLEDDNETKAEFVNGIFTVTSKKESSRKHTIIYGEHEIVSAKRGDFSIDLNGKEENFDWNFSTTLFRRLDIAEISYEQKDEILQQLSLIEEHEKQVAFIKTIENQELQNSLFELLYSGK